MTFIERISLFGPLDLVALGCLFGAWWLLGLLIEHPPRKYPSVTVLTFQYRREWMEQMVTREPRVFDTITMNGLREGTAFFGSGCMIAIGGVLAMAANTQPLSEVTGSLGDMQTPALLLQMKLLVVALLLTHAFLKFVWANRLFGYCAVTMAATPNDITDPRAPRRAAQAADIANRAAVNFNRGLRSIYFALAALGWLIAPAALIITTLIASFTILSREFASTSRETLRDT
jgi:uncharacterized membrane protein